jgi:purine-binding chemotaxis protein CheW
MQSESGSSTIERPTDTGGSTDQYLTFMLGDEEFGVDILRVQEIKGWEQATAIPNTPEYITGVMNLRGTVVPIIDLRRRFDLDSVDYLPTTLVIVLKVEGEHSTRTMGFVVDAVSKVYNVSPENLQPAPDFGTRVNTEFIRGLVVVEEKMLILLDFDRLIGLDSVFSAAEGLTDPSSAHPTSANHTEK